MSTQANAMASHEISPGLPSHPRAIYSAGPYTRPLLSST